MDKKIISKRFDDTKLNIGTYYLAPYARTETHVRDAAECGIDFFINIPNNSLILDLLSKYRIGAIVSNVLPNWFGGDGSNAGQLAMTNPIETYQAALDTFADAPNILGIDIGDEPSALDFEHYGRIFDLVQHTFPALQPYLNIYPNYAVKGSNTPEEIQKQLQTNNYAAYIESYCKNVNSDYICFDYYLYSATLSGLYKTLETVSAACKKYHRNLWMVLQVNSNQPDKWIRTDQLRFQAFTAMAFGAKNIIWACYTAGWWYNHVLDKEGNKTEQYDKLKKVNSEIHFLGSEYIKYQHLQTHYIGDFPVPDVESKLELTTSFVSNLRAENNEALLIGEMKSIDNKALFICASNDSCGQIPTSFHVSFHTLDYHVDMFMNKTRISLSPDLNNIFTFSIYSSEGVLLVFIPNKKN